MLEGALCDLYESHKGLKRKSDLQASMSLSLHTKFEMPSFTHFKDMIVAPKFQP